MPLRQSIFTPLEQAVLEAICRAHPEDRTAFEAQLATAVFVSRENTGCGFFTRFSTNRRSARQSEARDSEMAPPLRLTE